eukprot:1626790-Rhodomonas_salina.2
MNAVRLRKRETKPRAHMMLGNTKTVSTASSVDHGSAVLSDSPSISRSIPSMKKKSTTPNALIGSTFCSISSRYGTEDRLTPAKKPPISGENSARPARPATPSAYPTVPTKSISPVTANILNHHESTYRERKKRMASVAANFPNIIAIETPKLGPSALFGSKLERTSSETTPTTSCSAMRPKTTWPCTVSISCRSFNAPKPNIVDEIVQHSAKNIESSAPVVRPVAMPMALKTATVIAIWPRPLKSTNIHRLKNPGTSTERPPMNNTRMTPSSMKAVASSRLTESPRPNTSDKKHSANNISPSGITIGVPLPSARRKSSASCRNIFLSVLGQISCSCSSGRFRDLQYSRSYSATSNVHRPHVAASRAFPSLGRRFKIWGGFAAKVSDYQLRFSRWKSESRPSQRA